MPDFNVSGMSAQAFMRDVFEKAPCVFRGFLPDGFYGMADLNSALTQAMTSELPFTIGLHGKTVRPDDYASVMYNGLKQTKQLRIDPEKVERLLQAGANLKIQRFSNVCRKVSSVVKDMESWLQFVTSANGYVSYGLQRGLPVHWDSHDVVAVQLLGRKHWKVYKPTMEMPFKAHRKPTEGLPDLKTPVLELDLMAGDALYVPRGWWHDVTPIKGVKTAHLALGIHPPKVSEFVTWVLESEVSRYVAYRKSIPLDAQALDTSSLSAALIQALADPQLLKQFLADYNACKPPRAYFDIAGDA